jgi:RNA polymerase sigma factor (sigma-70 family)
MSAGLGAMQRDLHFGLCATEPVAPPGGKRTRIFPKSVARDRGKSLAFGRTMDELIKLVNAYRQSDVLDDRVRIAEEIFRVIEPKLRLYVFNHVRPSSADDVLQEALIAITRSLKNFAGTTEPAFLKWCFSVAWNKIKDQYDKQTNNRFQALPPDELLGLVDATAEAAPLSAGDRLDLEYAMNLLAQSKPECCDYLLKRYVIGLEFGEIAEEQNLEYDTARMRVERCLEDVRKLVA